MLSGHEKTRRSYKLNMTAILRACNEMFERIQNDSNVPGIIVDFSSCDSSCALNGLFTNKGTFGLLEAIKTHILTTCFRSSPLLSIKIAERETV